MKLNLRTGIFISCLFFSISGLAADPSTPSNDSASADESSGVLSKGSSEQSPTGDTITIVPTPKFDRAEYFYAPPPKDFAIQTTLGYTPIYRTQTSSLPSGNYANDVTTSASFFNLRGQYSITKNIAVDIGVGYRKDQNNLSATNIARNTQNSGLTDLAVGALYQLPTSFARYYFSLGGTFSPQRAEAASITADGNEYSGGWTLRPAVGITKRLLTPSLRVGAELTELYRAQRIQGDNQSPESDRTTTGGSATGLTIFGEYRFLEKFLASLRLNASQTSASTTTATGGTSLTGAADAFTTFGIGVGAFYYFKPWLTFRVDYDGTQFPARATSDTSGTTAVFVSTFSAAARFNF